MSNNINAIDGFASSDSILPESTQSCQDLSKLTQTYSSISSICDKHLAEWVQGSGVNPAVVDLKWCLRSLTDRKVVTARLGWKKYSDNLPLGWWVSGLDLATMKHQSFGQYKPDKEIRLNAKDEDTQKYLTPKKHLGPYDAIALPHATDKNYWQRILDDPSIPVDLDEGAKKSGAGMTCGFSSLALCGVTMWQFKGELVSNLAALAVPGRTFRIRFDMDVLTKKEVRFEIKKLVKVLEERGCTVLVAMWNPELGLKIDDVLVKQGPEMVKKIMAEAVPYPQWLKSLEAQMKESDSSTVEGSTKKRKRGDGEDVLANEIADKYRSKLAWHIPAQCWMRYEADSETMGIWSEEPKEVVRGLVMADLEVSGVNYTAALVSSICTHLQSLLGVKRWNDAATDLIPLKNGVFNFKTGKFKKHQPGYFLTWRLPYAYNPVATCELIVKWLEEAADDKQVARLLIAYLRAILTGRTDIHRLLELVGPGGSGKSTYSRLAQALIGTENTHTTTLVKLEGSRFETACLWNKRLAIINDSERYAGNVTVLKAATGGDTIPHEVKFVQSQRGFVFDGKVILTSNEIIQSSDYTSGLERRRITIPFLNRIPVENQRNLIEIKGDKVSGEFTDCLPGLFNLVVAMPDEEMEALLLKTDKLCPALAESKAETLLDTNPIAAWLDYCVVHDPDSRSQIGLAIPQKDKDIPTHFLNVDKFLYPSYCNYSKNSGSRAPLGLQRFVKLLDDLVKNQLKIDGVFREKDRSKKSYFVGLRIRQDGIDDDLPSPIFEHISGKVRRDCGGIRGGMKPIQRRDAGDAEGLLENSKNIEQVSEHTPCDESISPTEELKKPSASPASPGSKDLNPPHIPPHIPPHPSAASDTKKPETIASIEIVEKIRKAITNSDRALAVQILEVLEGKTQENLRNEVQDALAPSEIKNFKLLAKAEFVKTSPLPAAKFKIGDRVQVRSDYVTPELRGRQAVMVKDFGDDRYRIDFGHKIEIPHMEPKQVFDMDKKYFQIVTKDESDLQIPF